MLNIDWNTMQLINVLSMFNINSSTIPTFVLVQHIYRCSIGCPGQAEVASKELSSSTSRTTHNLDVVVVAWLESTDPHSLSISKQIISTCLPSNNMAITVDIFGRLAGVCCKQSSPIFMTRMISSVPISVPNLGSTKCHSSFDLYIFHAYAQAHP